MAFLDKESPRAAKAVHAAIELAIDSLGESPNRGRRAQAVFGAREFVVTGAPYVVLYSVEDKEVVVLRIRHTRQDPAP